MRRLLAACGVTLLTAGSASGQTFAAETSLTGGASTDGVSAGAVQGRLFGDVAGTRIFTELAWASVAGPDSDAFGSAYPYERDLFVMDAWAERVVRRRGTLLAARAGRFRTPFGIHGAADHAYGGFLRAPLIRYPGYWALSNLFLEHGMNVVAGIPALQAEYTVGTPADVGDERRRPGTDHVVRVQGYHGSLVIGVSHIRTQPYQAGAFVSGRARFSGIDVRWMHRGLQLRGEWIDGRPFDGTHTRGGYIDLLAHRPSMGPVTAVGRLEVLDYSAGRFSRLARRATLGARVRVAEGLHAQLNVARQMGALYGGGRTAVDAALTYTVRVAR